MIKKLWVLPCSLIGYLVLLFLGKEATLSISGTHLYITKRMFSWADAITFGEVILVRDGALCQRLINHETTHVWQYRKWGVLFFAIYLWGFIDNLIRFKDLEDAYWYIPFEVQARESESLQDPDFLHMAF